MSLSLTLQFKFVEATSLYVVFEPYCSALQKRIGMFTLFLPFLIYATRLRSDIENYNGEFVLLGFTFTERWVYYNSYWPFYNYWIIFKKIRDFLWCTRLNKRSVSKLRRPFPIMLPNLGKDKFLPRDLSVL